MQTIVRALAVCLFCCLFTPMLVLADTPTGSIHGSINYCEQGGYAGIQVYIPGRQFVVITGDDGQFLLENLAPGEFSIHYRLQGELLNQNSHIRLQPGQALDIGIIRFCSRGQITTTDAAPSATVCTATSQDPRCRDSDHDGTPAAEDCNDNNPAIYPGAIEHCDGLDNNCNGEVDDGSAANIAHGLGGCDNAQIVIMRCDSNNYRDCDGVATNGCETDISRDNEHCGSCNNACSGTEICSLGSC